MAKLKTNKAVRKRFRRTQSGKFKRMRAGRRHLLEKKSSKRKRHLRRNDWVSRSMAAAIGRLLPYA